MSVVIKSNGDVEKTGKGWNPEQVKFIVVEFRGKGDVPDELGAKGTYRYPINPTDLIEEIAVRVEEE